MVNLKKDKTKKIRTEEQEEVIRFVKVLVVVILVVVLIYFFTRAFVSKDLFDDDSSDKQVQAGAVDYDITILGSSLNRPYDHYFVMVYDSTDTKASKYATILSNYKKEKDAEKIYFADLNNELNKKFYDKDNSNPKASKVEDLKVGDFTLIEVKKGKIVSYIEDYEAAVKKLKVAK